MRNERGEEILPEGYKMTELGPLPKEWRVVRLGEVAEITSGGSAPQGKRYFLNGKNPFVRVQHLDIDGDYVRRWDLITDEAVEHYRLKKFPAGTIVFPKSGAAIRLEKRAILLVDAYIVSHLCAVLPETSKVDRWFIFYSLRAKKLAEHKAEGYPVLNLYEICDLPIPLPPLDEQRAIAHVLRTVQRAKEATEGVIAALRELKKSLMQHLFTYGPVPVTERERVVLQESEIGPIPAHWQVVRLGEVARMKQGKVLPTSSFTKYGYPVYGANGQIGWFSQYTHAEEEVLVTCRGATCGTINVSPPKSFITNNAMIVTPIQRDRLRKDYLALALQMADLSSCITGSGQPQITKGKLALIPIPLPPLPEQRAIAETLRAVDRRIEAEESHKQALDALFRSLLHNLMTAKIRLSPDFIRQFASPNATGEKNHGSARRA
jgi:type I restriction enzyme S subunit